MLQILDAIVHDEQSDVIQNAEQLTLSDFIAGLKERFDEDWGRCNG